MKKTVPFSKELAFKTKIAEITDIEVNHNLKKDSENTISGTFNVSGTYKMTEASQIEEKFEYELPFIIEVDDKYNLDNVEIKISDFYFEIINEDILKVNIEVELDNVLEKQEDAVFERCYDTAEVKDSTTPDDVLDEILDFTDDSLDNDKESVMDKINIKDDVIPIPINDVTPATKLNINVPITDMFTSINEKEDTFKAYHVYIVRENDTLDSIMAKYKVNRESLEEYNDLSEIKIGTKLIIPSSNE